MRRRLAIVFLLMVAVPIAVLGWLGARLAQHERSIVRHQFRTVLTDRLLGLDQHTARVVEGVERHLLGVTRLRAYDPETMWRMVRDEPLIRQVFVVSPFGNVVHPSERRGLSAEEREFLERTRPIWNRDAVLYTPPSREADRASYLPFQRPSLPDFGGSGDSILELARGADHGWITWYWEEGLHLLFWRRDPAGGVVGVEVERIALLAQLVSALPSEGLGAGRIVLSDSRGDPVYQWGPYEQKKDERAYVEQGLRYPLDSWRVQYFASPSQTHALEGIGFRSSLFASVGAVALVLLGLAAYFYREYSRDMVEAGRRVNFVTQVSHELKTPLTNIRLYAELLEDEVGEDERAEKQISVIVSESERLSRLIGNILTFSKQKNESVRLRKSPTVVDDVVRRVVEQFRLSLEAKAVAVDLQLSAPMAIPADPDAVEQILANLIGNVEKYAASGGRLSVETRQSGDETTVTVSDEGPGIPQAQRDKIFEAFYRISDKLSDGTTGTGIGLSISRELARLSGGDLVALESRTGASFRLILRSEGTS